MLLKRNLLESLTIFCCSGSFICILLNFVTNISPISGVWFLIYTFLLFIVAITCSIKILQWLLRLNKPLTYDLEELIKEYPYLSLLSSVLPKVPKRPKGPKFSEEYKEYDTNELSVISTVLERKLVSSWYVPFISQEIGFPFACKQLLDQIIGKAFQITNKIETKDVCIDICSVLIIHLKEYKKTLKRHEKSPKSSIEALYKKSHPLSEGERKFQPADHCVHILRIIFKELVPWELWDTPHSELLVRILSKKLDYFIDTTIANPVWLNDKLLSLILDKHTSTTSPVKEETVAESPTKTEEITKNPNENSSEPECVPDTKKLAGNSIEKALSTIIPETTALILQRAIDDASREVMVPDGSQGVEHIVEETGSDPLEVQSSLVLRQRRGRQGKNEVKIYDRIIEGSTKTWETDMDLQCISLGQDLLASLDGEITLSRLWGQDGENDGSPNPPRRKSPQPAWFGEEDLDMELSPHDTSPPLSAHTPPAHKHSPKPTDLLIKDLQTTVHQAKSKIGDLQVDATFSGIAVSRSTSGDEAAGMMEGLLDFGIAGLKKGLRFTGLSDDIQEKEKSPLNGKELSSSPPLQFDGRMKLAAGEPRETELPVESKEVMISTSEAKDVKLSASEAKEVKISKDEAKDVTVIASQPKYIKGAVNSAVTLKEENVNISNGVPHLVKQYRVISQDSLPPLPSKRPPPLPLDSPEPQYEEAADLSTSIAKLRSLLQQRTCETSEEHICWEGAEETRGRTQQRHCGRPVDAATCADEYDMNAERSSSPGQTSNNMQRLDKLFQRTVTGVFNSIKTAVGAEGDEPHAGQGRDDDWTYVCASVEMSVSGAVARLVGSRRAHAHVDAALDTLEQLPRAHDSAHETPDDLDEWCAVNGACYSAVSELLCAAELTHSHVTHRVAALLLADISEALIHTWLNQLTSWLKTEIFSAFEQMSRQPDSGGHCRPMREMDLDETRKVVLENLPAPLQLFGEDRTTAAVKLITSSLSHKELNRDIAFRLLDLFALRFHHSAGLRNPSFEN